jgi:hypothetical protein
MFRIRSRRLLPVFALAAIVAAATSSAQSSSTAVGGGRHTPDQPVWHERTPPPVNPIDVDRDLRHAPIGRPDPSGRGSRAMSSNVLAQRPGHGLTPTDAGLFAFKPAVQFQIGTHPLGTVVADLFGDRRVEIAVTSSRPERVTILQNFGRGDFGRPIEILLPPGSGPDQIVAADFTGDGRADLCVALRDMNAVAFIENGRAFSEKPLIVATGSQPRWLATGDFDKNGWMDVVVSNGGSGSITFLLNDGNGGFKRHDVDVGADPRAIAAADLDGDSWPDVAVAVAGTNSLVLVKNERGESFKIWQTIPTGRFVPEGLLAADLEGDGDVDICITAAGADFAHMLTFLNGGSGQFDLGLVADMEGGGASFLAAGDFDLDQNLDLACVAAGDPVVSVWHNLGMGRFATYAEFGAGRAPSLVVAADLDGNGSPDLVVTNSDADSIAILLNQVPGIAGVPFCFGDGSGTACPARNTGAPGHGCDNVAGTGGVLLATSGAARVSNDTLKLDATDLPRARWIAFFQGTDTVDRGIGVPFSRGLACLGGDLIRIALKDTAQGALQYPSTGEEPVSAVGLIPPSGGTRYYQVWYRDNGSEVTFQAYNLSNALEVNWIP